MIPQSSQCLVLRSFSSDKPGQDTPKYPLRSLMYLDRIYLLGFPRNQCSECAISTFTVFSSDRCITGQNSKLMTVLQISIAHPSL